MTDRTDGHDQRTDDDGRRTDGHGRRTDGAGGRTDGRGAEGSRGSDGIPAPGAGAIRFGIVGAGKVAEVHASVLRRIGGAQVVAVTGRSEQRTRALAERHRLAVEATLDALLARPDIDAVVVATPHPLHAEQARAIAASGRHVVIEKPMALSVAECDSVLNAAAAAGVVVSVVSQRRFYPAVRRVRDAIDEGRIGDPGLVYADMLGWRGSDYYAMDDWRGTMRGEGGGVLVNQAIHQIDLVRWFGGPVAEVDGFTANLNHPEIEVEDTAVATIRFAGGALGVLVASNSQRPGLWGRVHVHGRNGASVGVETDLGSAFLPGLSRPAIARNDLWTVPGEEALPERWAAEDERALDGEDLGEVFHERQLRDVVDAIRTGREPTVTGRDGRAAVALMEAIYRASATGRRVRVDDAPTSGAPADAEAPEIAPEGAAAGGPGA